MMRRTEMQTLALTPICLEWSDWISWNDLKIAIHEGGMRVPKSPGVYEVRYVDSDERLTIGKTGDLSHRVKDSLVKGKYPHSAGKRIRATEDVSMLLVRWAVTERPAAAEEELHRLYQEKNGCLPKFTISTR